MSRSPRRPARVKPPLRGRAATKQYRGNFAPITTVRRPLPPRGAATLPRQEPFSPPPEKVQPPVRLPENTKPSTEHPPENSLHTDTVYTGWESLLHGPWRWFLILVVILSGLLLLKQLF